MNDLNIDLAPLSTEQLVRFAGAVQDFNPIHYDDQFARSVGLPGVIAQGPLTYLIALDALLANQGPGQVGGFAVRLKAPVVPGTPLRLVGSADGKVSLRAGESEALAGTVTPAEGSRA